MNNLQEPPFTCVDGVYIRKHNSDLCFFLDIMGMSGAPTPGEPSSLIGATMTSPSLSYIDSLDAHLDRNEQDEINADPESRPYREISLTKGLVTLVDASDFPWLNQHKWYARWNPNTRSYYAARNSKKADGFREGGKRYQIKMHREILGLKRGDPIQGDHKDGDSLNNRRLNLRKASNAQNVQNQPIDSTNKTGLKGAFRRKVRYSPKKWSSAIEVNNKRISLGIFSTAEEAHQAYRSAAKKYHGEFARFE
jgi:hypothetical protein